MARSWTPAQRQAIEARGGTVLVSAAAGSGKTAVLVERLLGRLTDPERPVDIDRVLVVTFTKAAAAEMRSRLGAALSERIAADPRNLRLQRQQLLLPGAAISTIHGFCAALLKEQAHLLDISPDFQVAEQAQAVLLQEEAMAETLEAQYAAHSEDFAALASLLSSGRSDAGLSQAVKKLYQFVQSHPFPDRWLREQERAYARILPAADTPWGEQVLRFAGEALQAAGALLRKAVSLSGEEEQMAAAYLPVLQADLAALEQAAARLPRCGWDEAAALLGSLAFGRLGALRQYPDPARQERVKALRAAARKRVDSLQKLFFRTEADCAADLAACRPLVRALCDTVRVFTDRYTARKRARRLLDFDDLEHLALSLLLRPRQAEETADGNGTNEGSGAAGEDDSAGTGDGEQAVPGAAADGGAEVEVGANMKIDAQPEAGAAEGSTDGGAEPDSGASSGGADGRADPEAGTGGSGADEGGPDGDTGAPFGAGVSSGAAPDGGESPADADSPLSGFERTPLARELSARFQEILVDEYQDTNAAQDALFEALSQKGRNLFLVGDVKQSIYGFRRAMPELFLRRRDSYPPYDGVHFPATITLGHNFRSRREVTDSVNFLFSQLMTPALCGIDYTQGEALVCAASYPEATANGCADRRAAAGGCGADATGGRGTAGGTDTAGGGEDGSTDAAGAAGIMAECAGTADSGIMAGGTDPAGGKAAGSAGAAGASGQDGGAAGGGRSPFATELLVVDTAGVKKSDGGDEAEARLIAQKIHAYMAHTPVHGPDGPRKAQYRDFCILLRSKSAHASKYVDELNRQGIPAFSSAAGGFFEAYEVSLALSLLRLIDNPLQDVPLLAVMLSPLFGFTPDDLAAVREADRQNGLYTAVRRAGRDPSPLGERCREFLRRIDRFRTLSATLPADRLLHRLYEDTGLLAAASAMPHGAQRAANLRLLHAHARRFEQNGFRGLSAFVRFLDRLCQQEVDLAPASLLGEHADAVRVMSIHHSKGLEFPVVFLAGLGTAFNRQSLQGPVLLHADLGVGFLRQDEDTLVQTNTLPRQGIALAIERGERTEELRVLYVAMTRAREKLCLLVTLPKPAPVLTRLAAGLDDRAALPAYTLLSAGSLGEWLLLCALRHPSGGELRRLAQAEDLPLLPAETAWDIEVVPPPDTAAAEAAAEEECCEDNELYGLISERIAYRYPYAALQGVPNKLAASALSHEAARRDLAATARPAFLGARGLTPAQRGTALHTFLQFSDYEAAARDPKAERQRLVARGHLTPQQADAIELARVRQFFRSPLYARIARADRCWRELPFTVERQAGELWPALRGAPGADEPLVIQGIADCVLEEDGALVIIDYKTDRVRDPAELAGRYAGQLRIYRSALAETLGMPVKACLLYAFALGREVEIPQEETDGQTDDGGNSRRAGSR